MALRRLCRRKSGAGVGSVAGKRKIRSTQKIKIMLRTGIERKILRVSRAMPALGTSQEMTLYMRHVVAAAVVIVVLALRFYNNVINT